MILNKKQNYTWPTKKLRELAEVQSGFGFPMAIQGKTYGEIPFYKVSDMNLIGNETDMIFHNNAISESQRKSMRYKSAPAGTIIFPKIGAAVATNKKRILSRSALYDNNVMGLIPSNNILSKYLYFWLLTFNISFWASESMPPSIKKSTVEKFKIPLPPLQIQKQIVERMDKIAEAQKLNDELIQKSDELFQSLLHQELNPAGKDWEVKKLVEILKPQYGYTEAAKEAGNYRFIRITDIGDDGELRDSDKKYVTISPNEAENYQLRNGDLLLARTGATFGKILYFKENEPSIFASFLIRLNPNTSIDPFYIWLFSRSQSYWRQAKSLMTGSGQPQFNANKLKQIKIPLPPLTTQKQIVAKLSAVQEYKNQLLSQKTKLKELFDSVLHKSMNGELIN